MEGKVLLVPSPLQSEGSEIRDFPIVTEIKSNCVVSKAFLDFNLNGSPCPVSKLHEDEKSAVEDTIVLANSSRYSVSFQIPQYDSNPKFKLWATPASGTLKGKTRISITFHLQVFCTTRISHDVIISLTIKEKFSFHKHMQKIPSISLSLSTKIDSELSAQIDYDEIQIEKEVASGGFGTVYKAKWRGLDVALKQMHAQDLTPLDRELYNREIKVMKALSCPYIVTYIGSTHIPGQPLALIMEYVKKGSLTSFLQQDVSTRLKYKVVLDVAKGMSFLHFNNIYHRDLKPDNVLVVSAHEDADVNVKITDFDTARAYLTHTEENGSELHSSKVDRWLGKDDDAVPEKYLSKNLGTLVYKAPEIIAGKTKYKIDKCDVFSFAVLMWQVFTRKKPFADPPYDKMDVRGIENFIMGGMRLPIPKSVPTEISNLIESCWQQDPNKRQDFSFLSSKLQQILDGIEGGLRSSKGDLHHSEDKMNGSYPGIPPYDPSNASLSPRISSIQEHHQKKTHSSPLLISPHRGGHSMEELPNGQSNSENNAKTKLKRGLSISGEIPKPSELPAGYVGEMDRLEAEKMLGHEPGNYLVRYSKDAYVISYVSNEGRFMHIRAAIISTGLKVDSTSGKSEEFESLLSLTNTMIRRKYIAKPIV